MKTKAKRSLVIPSNLPIQFYTFVRGKSMQPTIQDGEQILVTMRKSKNIDAWDLTGFVGKVAFITYIIPNTGEKRGVVKEIAFVDGINNRVLLKSHNPQFKPFWMPFRSIVEILTPDKLD